MTVLTLLFSVRILSYDGFDVVVLSADTVIWRFEPGIWSPRFSTENNNVKTVIWQYPHWEQQRQNRHMTVSALRTTTSKCHMTVSALRTTTSKPSYDGTRMARVKILFYKLIILYCTNQPYWHTSSTYYIYSQICIQRSSRGLWEDRVIPVLRGHLCDKENMAW
jgi:hypothetical protein